MCLCCLSLPLLTTWPGSLVLPPSLNYKGSARPAHWMWQTYYKTGSLTPCYQKVHFGYRVIESPSAPINSTLERSPSFLPGLLPEGNVSSADLQPNQTYQQLCSIPMCYVGLFQSIGETRMWVSSGHNIPWRGWVDYHTPQHNWYYSYGGLSHSAPVQGPDLQSGQDFSNTLYSISQLNPIHVLRLSWLYPNKIMDLVRVCCCCSVFSSITFLHQLPIAQPLP